MEVRDPIHGAIPVEQAELVLLDDPFLQRLRHITAMGFTALPFPGATHTRYAHSVGAMHLAGQAFDRAYSEWTFTAPERRATYRQLVRIAALCHDLGHGPLSHSSEFAMPDVRALAVPFYDDVEQRPATHEDYTLAILGNTTVGDAIRSHCAFTARHVAALIHPGVRTGDDLFQDGGFDHRRLLSQLISSELDVDRLDYLVRDATFSGAQYGLVDVRWLLSNLVAWPKDGSVSLGLDHAAVYAFDDFIIARHHMFLMVYFHHRSVCCEELLRRWGTDTGFTLPSDLDDYLHADDGSLWQALRRSQHPAARRIVENRIYKRVVEKHGPPDYVDVSREVSVLKTAEVDFIEANATGRLSRYFVRGKRTPGLFVVDRFPGSGQPRARPLQEATDIYGRYADARRIARVYVAPEDYERARALLDRTA